MGKGTAVLVRMRLGWREGVKALYSEGTEAV